MFVDEVIIEVKAGNGGDKPSMTKDQILAVKNPSERQKLIAENITLFQ